MPHSEINTLKCCNSCNGSKKDKDVLKWIEFKEYKVPQLVLNLLKKQK